MLNLAPHYIRPFAWKATAFLAATAISLLVAASCTKKDDFVQQSIEEVTDEFPLLTSIKEYQFDPLGGSTQFSYPSDGRWTIDAPDWVSVSPKSGDAGRYIISITAGLNTSWSDRNRDTLYINRGRENEQKIPLEQKCPRLELGVTGLALDGFQAVNDTPTSSSPVGEFVFPFLWSHSKATDPVVLSFKSNFPWKLSFYGKNEVFAISEDGRNWVTTELKGAGGPDLVTIYLLPLVNCYGLDPIPETDLWLRAYENQDYAKEIPRSAIAQWKMLLTQTNLRFLIRTQGTGAGVQEVPEVQFDEMGAVKQVESSVYVQCELPWSISSGAFSKLKDGQSLIETLQGDPHVTESEWTERPYDIFHAENLSSINPYLDPLVDTIWVRAYDQGVEVAKRAVPVAQSAYIFKLNTSSPKEFDLPNGLFLAGGDRVYSLEEESQAECHSVSFRSSGLWKATLEEDETDGSWTAFPADMDRGSGGTAVETSFYVTGQNLHLDRRLQSALVLEPDYYGWEDVDAIGYVKPRIRIPITQDTFLFNADYANNPDDKLPCTVTYDDPSRTGLKQIPIVSDGPWKLAVRETDGSFRSVTEGDLLRVGDADQGALSSADWQDALTGNPVVYTVGFATVNPEDEADRTASLWLISQLHETLDPSVAAGFAYVPQELRFIQRKFTFELNGGKYNLTIPAYKSGSGSYAEFTIESDGNWIIDSKPEGWKFYRAGNNFCESGESGSDLKLYLQSADGQVINQSGDAREMKVTFVCTYEGRAPIERELTFNQPALTFQVARVNPSNTPFPAVSNYYYEAGGAYLGSRSWDFKVDATDELPWKLVCDDGDEWIVWNDGHSTLTSSGLRYGMQGSLEEGKIYPGSNASTENEPRYSFHFETTDSRMETVRSAGYEIQQAKYVWGAPASIANISFNAIQGKTNGNAHIEFTCSGPWKVEPQADWLSGVQWNGSSNPTFDVGVTMNTSSTDSRDQEFTITSLLGGYSIPFRVIQEPYYFSVTASGTYQFNTLCAALGDARQQVTFTCAGSWEVQGAPEDMDFDRKSGAGDGTNKTQTISFRPSNHMGANDHSGSFTIVSKEVPSLKGTVSYMQPAYVFSLSPTQYTTTKATDTKAVTVTISKSKGEKWTLLSGYDSNALRVTPESYITASSTSEDIIVTPKAYYGTDQDSRTTLTFKSELGNKEQTMTLVRKKYVFTASSTSFTFSGKTLSQDLTISSEGPWKIEQEESSKSWLTVSPSQGATACTNLKVILTVVDDNSAKDATDRSTTLVFVGNDSPTTLRTEITVSQPKQ